MSLNGIINKIEKFYSQLDIIIHKKNKKNESLILDYFCIIAVASVYVKSPGLIAKPLKRHQ